MDPGMIVGDKIIAKVNHPLAQIIVIIISNPALIFPARNKNGSIIKILLNL